MSEQSLEQQIENILRTTLVIENKQSIYIAVDKLKDLLTKELESLTP